MSGPLRDKRRGRWNEGAREGPRPEVGEIEAENAVEFVDLARGVGGNKCEERYQGGKTCAVKK